jgi:HPt (histidine-containing phosphotransfer) domain-containing protein
MTGPLLDRAVIDDMIAHIGADALRPVVDLFIDESRRFAAQIGTAAAAGPGQRDAARRAAHSLKSSAGQLGAAALSAQAAELERLAEGATPLADAAAALATCVEATAAALLGLFRT